MVLLGIDIERFLLQHLRSGDGKSLYILRAVAGAGGSSAARHHHDDIVAVAAPRPCSALTSRLNDLLGLLELDLLLAAAVHLNWLVDQSLPVRGLQDLLAVLDLYDLLAPAHLTHWQHLDLLVVGQVLAVDPTVPLHVLHNDLLTIGSLDHLLSSLTTRNHPDNKNILDTHRQKKIF